MKKQDIFNKLKDSIIVPVVRVENSEDAQKVVDILIEVGIKAAEITMSVKGAEKVIETLRNKYDNNIIVGAGTVLSKEDAKMVIEYGAEFVVSPCFLEEVVAVARENNILVAPGTFTPTEIIKAYKYGSDFIKVFPASYNGGAKFIKSVKAVYPFIDLMPTGGVNPDTVIDFLEAGSTFLGVGSYIVNNKLVKENKFDEIKERALKIVNKVNEYKNK